MATYPQVPALEEPQFGDSWPEVANPRATAVCSAAPREHPAKEVELQVAPAPKPKQAGATLLLKLKSTILAKNQKEEQHAEQLQEPGI